MTDSFELERRLIRMGPCFCPCHQEKEPEICTSCLHVECKTFLYVDTYNNFQGLQH